MIKLFSIKLFVLLLTLTASPGYGQPAGVDNTSTPIIDELTSLAKSDASNNIDRRTEFIIELYKNNPEGLATREIQSTYDNAFSAQVKQSQQQTNTRRMVAGAATLAGLGIAAYVIDRKRVLKIKK
ncbi:MAG: hypothetical protein F6K11_31350, partial [Leptolyngbya sp. SIO3F4]|nr:hypothetical protein [Leptolyngbya sp. SIO3F4]